MKYKSIIAILFVLSTVCVYAQKVDSQNIIGEWKFVEMLDQNGKHIDTLKEDNGFRIAQEANYHFRTDSTYSAQFTATNIDTGTWSYNASENAIILKLYWNKPYDEATQYIIAMGLSTKDERGDYFDLIPKKINELTSEKLVILDKENRKIVYTKAK